MWKTIEYEPEYEISDTGQVRNKTSLNIKSLRLSRNGYLRVTLYPSGKTYNIHRLVAEAFLKNRNETVNHRNGVKTDNRLENLEWISQKDNLLHAVRNGLSKYRDWSGVNNPNYRGII